MKLLGEKLPPSLEKVLREQVKRKVRASLTDWTICGLSAYGQVPAAHHRLLIKELEAVERRETKRLMIFMPPGSAKSTYSTVLFPSWLMARKMNLSIIGASHTADLAEDFSRRIQRNIKEYKDFLGYSLTNEAANLWGTSNGGRYRAAGVGGPIGGFRADFAIVDDAIKGRKDADSTTNRDTVYNWFKADLLTRLRPNAALVLINTRWHEDDLSGRLLNDNPDLWKVLKLPAIAEANDPLGRAIGEPLWNDDPDYKYGELLETIREEQGERDWWSLYQQSPRALSGGVFKTEQIGYVDAVPIGTRLVRAWDLAATAETGGRDPDWTCGALLGRTPQGGFIVADLVRLRGGPDEVERALVATASRDGKRVTISLPQDPGQAGKSQILYLTRKLAGYKVHSSTESGDKGTRAAPFASQVNVGNVAFVHNPAWNKDAINEFAAFPGGAHDDIVDACSRGFELASDTSATDRFSALAS
jgi:predicted phage terminase large subunit-like protein